MALQNLTAQLFADTLINMVKQMPLEKVRVDELCRICGTNRRTFYNHFKDKYDLVAWIYVKDFSISLEELDGKFCLEFASRAFRRLKEKEVFYKKAFSDRSQNTITQYLYDMFVRLGMDKVMKYTGRESLEHKEIYLIKSHAFACIGHTKEWLEGKTDYTPEELAKLQIITMPEFLKKAYENV